MDDTVTMTCCNMPYDTTTTTTLAVHKQYRNQLLMHSHIILGSSHHLLKHSYRNHTSVLLPFLAYSLGDPHIRCKHKNGTTSPYFLSSASWLVYRNTSSMPKWYQMVIKCPWIIQLIYYLNVYVTQKLRNLLQHNLLQHVMFRRICKYLWISG